MQVSLFGPYKAKVCDYLSLLDRTNRKVSIFPMRRLPLIIGNSIHRINTTHQPAERFVPLLKVLGLTPLCGTLNKCNLCADANRKTVEFSVNMQNLNLKLIKEHKVRGYFLFKVILHYDSVTICVSICYLTVTL